VEYSQYGDRRVAGDTNEISTYVRTMGPLDGVDVLVTLPVLTPPLQGIILYVMDGRKQFDTFEATTLYCPRCGEAMPVRKRLLLVLPDGEKYEYLCMRCGCSLGEKKETNTMDHGLIIH
jgi:hypothetical protein